MSTEDDSEETLDPEHENDARRFVIAAVESTALKSDLM
jgi:hypothetical protein